MQANGQDLERLVPSASLGHTHGTTATITSAKTVAITSAPGHKITLTLNPGFTLYMARVLGGAFKHFVCLVPCCLW